MIDKEQARELVQKHLATHYSVPGDSLVILDQYTRERRFGWVFFYNSKRYLETRRAHDAIAGNGPVMINKHDGTMEFSGSGRLVQWFIERYERKLARRKEPGYSLTSVELLLAEVDRMADRSSKTFELWVPEDLTLRGEPVGGGVAMGMILTRILDRGYLQDDVTDVDDGTCVDSGSLGNPVPCEEIADEREAREHVQVSSNRDLWRGCGKLCTPEVPKYPHESRLAEPRCGSRRLLCRISYPGNTNSHTECAESAKVARMIDVVPSANIVIAQDRRRDGWNDD